MAKLILTEDAIQLLLKSAQSDTSLQTTVLKFLFFKKLPFFPLNTFLLLLHAYYIFNSS